MTDDVYDVLSELHKYYFILRKDYCVDGKKDFLFYSKSGNLLNITSFNYELKKAVEKYNETAEYKIDKISAHTLRHTGCTRDAEDGMDILWGIPIHRLQTMFTITSMKNARQVRSSMWLKGAETGHKRQKIHTPIFVLRKRIFTPILHQSCVEICEFIIGYVK
jgi:integrase